MLLLKCFYGNGASVLRLRPTNTEDDDNDDDDDDDDEYGVIVVVFVLCVQCFCVDEVNIRTT